MPEVIIHFGAYRCSACSDPLYFERCNITEASFIIAACERGHESREPERNCPMWRVRLKIPVERLQCDLALREMQEVEL